ncbi:MAG: hypothetical protein IJ775_01900 [Muribaculaceae bacterium]|nr:hypothetical protein [Muribaculaceae bacterium]
MDKMTNVSELEMLALWKQVMRVEPVRRECVVERDDGIDLDAFLLTHLRQWYAHLLLTAPLEWVSVEDMSADVMLTADDEGVVTAVKPERYVRAVEWKLAGWAHSVTRFLAPDDAQAVLQRSLWTRGGPCRPAIVEHYDRLELFSVKPGASPVLLMARCVAVPAEGRYVLHQDALSTLPRWPL